MILTGDGPITAVVSRDEDEPLECRRYSCVVTSADGVVELSLTGYSWAEAVSVKRMMIAINDAARITGQTYELKFLGNPEEDTDKKEDANTEGENTEGENL